MAEEVFNKKSGGEIIKKFDKAEKQKEESKKKCLKILKEFEKRKNE